MTGRRGFLGGLLATAGAAVLPRSAQAVWPYVPPGAFNSDLNLNNEWFNIVSFGAIGDGGSHPASGVYGSMGALLAAYPFATALTNEINWLAVQAAWKAALAAGGGVVFCPYGFFRMTNANSALDGSGTIGALPDGNPGFPTGTVSFLGIEGGTVLQWLDDLGMPATASFTGTISGTTLTTTSVTGSIIPSMFLGGAGITLGTNIVRQLTGSPNGAGTYLLSASFTIGSPEAMFANFYSRPNPYGRRLAIVSGNYNDPNDNSPGYFMDLVFQGPGAGSTLGASACAMIGVGTNDRRELTRVRSNGFFAGVLLVGGQTRWQECYFNHNFYGVHLQYDTNEFGDMHWDRCDFSLNNMAGLAAGPVHSPSGTVLTKCIFDAQPYGIYKEPWTTAFINAAGFGPASFVNGAILTDITLDQCQFENVGNAAIGDGLFVTGNFTGSISGTTLTTIGSPLLQVGQQLLQALGGPVIAANTFIVGIVGANSFTVSPSQTVASGTIAAQRSSFIFNTVISRTQMGWWITGGAPQMTVQIAALPASGLIECGAAIGLKIKDPTVTFQWGPGSDAIFDISRISSGVGSFTPQQGFTISGDISALINNASVGSLSGHGFFSNAMFTTPGATEIDNQGFWKGEATEYVGFGSVAIGSVILAAGGSGVLCAGTPADNVMGILVYASTWGLVAKEGVIGVLSGSNSITAGQYVRTAAGGIVTGATGKNDTTSVVIGYALQASGSGSVVIRLQGIK